jgi:hypothetical protein
MIINSSDPLCYHLRVQLGGFDFVEVPYSLAWWAGADERPGPGDFNSDGSVDAADYVVWRKNDGSPEEYDEWRANFGNTSGGGGALGSTVPEPAAWSLLSVIAVGWIAARRRLEASSQNAIGQ